MTRAKGHVLLALAAAGILITQKVSAQQVVVLVTTDDAAPVPGATVAFWVRTRQVLSLQTRSDGQAIVDQKRVRGLSSVAVRAIGFQPSSEKVAGKDTIRVELTRVAPRLPDIVVEPLPRYECRPDEPAARAVWRTAMSRYTLPLSRGYSARGRGATEDEVLSRVSSPDVWGEASWGVSGQARTQSLRFVRDSGYAIRRHTGRPAGIPVAGDGGQWWYPRLHTWISDHFARPEFGEFNALYVLSSGPTGWTVGFCSRRTKRPGIAGVMRIDSDYAFQRAEWQFMTGKPMEDAGGEIVFLAGTRSALLPLVSYFWRRLDRTDGDEAVYHREAFMGEEWTINLGEPLRADSAEGSPR